MDLEREALFRLSPEQAMRLALLRIAAELAPRLSMGARAEDVVARARVLEVYVASPSPGSADASGPADPERGVPEPAADPDDPPAAELGAAGSEADRQTS